MRPVHYITLGILTAALQICASNEHVLEQVNTLHETTADVLTEMWCDLTTDELVSGKRQIEIDSSDPYMMGYTVWSQPQEGEKKQEVQVEDKILSYSPDITSADQEGSN